MSPGLAAGLLCMFLLGVAVGVVAQPLGVRGWQVFGLALLGSIAAQAIAAWLSAA